MRSTIATAARPDSAARRCSQARWRQVAEHHLGGRPREGTSTGVSHHPQGTTWPGTLLARMPGTKSVAALGVRASSPVRHRSRSCASPLVLSVTFIAPCHLWFPALPLYRSCMELKVRCGSKGDVRRRPADALRACGRPPVRCVPPAGAVGAVPARSSRDLRLLPSSPPAAPRSARKLALAECPRQCPRQDSNLRHLL